MNDIFNISQTRKLGKVSKYLAILMFFFIILLMSVNAKTDSEKIDDILDKLEKFGNITYIGEVGTLKKQPPTLNVFGTDYFFNDSGKIFLQALSDGVPIDNATCRTTAYYPNATSIFINDQFMLNIENGLHYFNFIVPELSGVYMVIADCQFFTDREFYFDPDSVLFMNTTIIRADENIGHPIVLNDFKDGLYQRSNSDQQGNTFFTEIRYTFNKLNKTNVSNPILVWTGESDGTPLLEFYFLNYTNGLFTLLPNTLQLGATIIQSVQVPTGANEIISNDLPPEAFNSTNNAVIIMNSTSSNDHEIWTNFLNIVANNLISQSNNEIRGGGEIHITDKAQTIILSTGTNVNNINTNVVSILEEINLLGDVFIAIPLFIIGLLILLLVRRPAIILVGFAIFSMAFVQFTNLQNTGMAFVSLALALITLLKAVQLRKNEQTSQYFSQT